MVVKKKGLLMLIICLLMLNSAFAQNDAKARSILAEVSKKFRSYDIVKADFTYTYTNQQANTKQSQSGTLYVKSKTDKFKVVLPSQELISDGKNQWTYLKDDKEVQVSEIDKSEDALNPAKIFTIYEKGFKYVYTGEVKANNKVYQNIELAPLATRSFSKIKLSVDKQNKQISSFTIYDKNGNVYTYTVKALTPNVKVSESIFLFNAAKYPGVEVVDLR